MRIICITLDDETASRLGELISASNFGVNEQIAAMINLEYEQWQDDSRQRDEPRSARWLRFLRFEQN